MNQHAILMPMLAQMILTLSVLFLIPCFRVFAIFQGKAHIKDYRYGDTESVPVTARLINRNLKNLLEIPVIFYALCLLIFVTELNTSTLTNLAWAFVAFRLVHSVIHIAYNNVNHRFAAFLGSVVSLIVMLILVLMSLLTS